MAKKLQRMKKHIVREEKLEPIVKPDKKIRCWDAWEAAGAKLFHFEDEYCITREMNYSLEYKHGHYTFADAEKTIHDWAAFNGNHPLSAKGFLPSDLFFFDIETTGLSGTGSVIFLLGTARLNGSRVTVNQYFLPSPGNETALYAKFLKETDYTTLVTYNGKSFDWPQVKSRHTFVRERVPSLPSFGHFDLYHASRRLFKHTMDSVKLVNVEKNILGIERTGDVPGHLAPIIYFDYVERGDPEGVLQVMKHNERDILSLITLYTHISRLVLDESLRSDDRTAFEIAKWFESSGNHAAARTAFETSVKRGEGEISNDAAYRLAIQLKREKSYSEAASLLERVSKSKSTRAFDAAIELAKLYEHRWKQVGQAIEAAEQALELTNDSVKKREVEHRLTRLKRKMSIFNEN
ncbi:ribonuclease H-like domain-containing protein [Domibacillus epiphyticus]|nr:ribonuclease H-like domain-containing protein [Domibacillus epiphyticus]